MPQHRSPTRLLAVGLGCALLAVACSSGGGGDDNDSSSEDEEVSTVEAAVAAVHAIGDAAPSCTAETDGVLRIGELRPPSTGGLGFLGAPMRAGAQVAVEEINAAGGVNGQPVEYLLDTTADAPDTEEPQVDIAAADAVVGATTSTVTEDVLAAATDTCTVLFSPFDTDPSLAVTDDGEVFFRTAASDILVSQALAELALSEGMTNAAIMARQGTYGEDMTALIAQAFEAQNGSVVFDATYDPEGDDASPAMDELAAMDPAAVFVIGFTESSRIVQGLLDRGFTADRKRIYLVGDVSNGLGEALPQAGGLVGTSGIVPAAPTSDDLRNRLHIVDPLLATDVHGAETYDAVVVSALAATAAASDRADEMARRINAVTREGTKCFSFVECRDLLAGGVDIDYDGQSGPLDFSQPGEPTTANVAVLRFGPDNRIDPAQTQFRPVALAP